MRNSVKDQDSVLKALRRAARDGSLSAAFLVARLYDEGWGVVRNPTVAARWYEVAARGGLREAFYFVASAYHFGEGVLRDVEAGYSWFQRASAAGDLTGTYMAAVCVFEGVGTPAQPKVGMRLLRNAARLGSPDAMDYLAAHYIQRGFLKLAKTWARRAIQAGDTVAPLRLKEIAELEKQRVRKRAASRSRRTQGL